MSTQITKPPMTAETASKLGTEAYRVGFCHPPYDDIPSDLWRFADDAWLDAERADNSAIVWTEGSEDIDKQ